jgi:general secretion pathway protein N
MKDWLRANPLLAMFVVLGVMLAVAIGLEAAFGTNISKVLDPSERKRAVPADAKLLPALVAVGPEQAYPETVARPLFLPTRRPAPEAPTAAQGALQRGQYVLQGVIVVGDQRVAMVREKSSGKVQRIESGKDFNGMKVVSIERESVTLGVGTDEEKLVLSVQKPPNPGAPAPAPAAAPAPQATAGPFAPPPVPAAAAAAPVVPPGSAAAWPLPPGTSIPIPAKPAAGANPAGGTAEAATAAPLTPEEALARRRAARRNNQ